MIVTAANSVVYLELQTSDLSQACAFFERLFGWRAEAVRIAGQTYLTLDLGDHIEGGVVKGDVDQGVWLPYVEVDDVQETTERACMIGASVVLAPREGIAGWRSIVAAPAGGEIAFWQPKR